ncbi:MAG: hypothetical protein ABSG05_02020 [Candidatus Pacearchaeota archaeon]|jgi:hypothetical protein
MKKDFILAIFAFFIILGGFSLTHADTSSCNLQVSLVNQDPYPAVQGDTVKLLFQVSGVQSSNCNGAMFELNPGYAFSLTENNSVQTLSGSTFTQNSNNNWVIPYTLNVNPNAPDGDSQVQVFYSAGNALNFPASALSQTFNVTVQNSRTSFEIFVSNYDTKTKTITFQILNTGKVDVKAVAIQIPEQKTLQVKGANTNIVGDIDSNSYTTADFLGTPSNGNITLQVSYSDLSGIRRTIEQNVTYDSVYFTNVPSQSGSSGTTIIIVLIIIAVIGYFFYRNRKKKKRLLAERRNRIK